MLCQHLKVASNNRLRLYLCSHEILMRCQSYLCISNRTKISDKLKFQFYYVMWKTLKRHQQVNLNLSSNWNLGPKQNLRPTQCKYFLELTFQFSTLCYLLSALFSRGESMLIVAQELHLLWILMNGVYSWASSTGGTYWFSNPPPGP